MQIVSEMQAVKAELMEVLTRRFETDLRDANALFGVMIRAAATSSPTSFQLPTMRRMPTGLWRNRPSKHAGIY